MKVITVEERFRSKQAEEFVNPYFQRGAKLADIGAGRIVDMDKSGIDMQVLSHTVPSQETLDAARAIPLCQK